MNNHEAIARGKGSSQARDEGCQMCGEEEEETGQDKSTSQACWDEPKEYGRYNKKNNIV